MKDYQKAPFAFASTSMARSKLAGNRSRAPINAWQDERTMCGELAKNKK